MFQFGSFRIGKILGIDVEVNYTWFLIFLLVTISYGSLFTHDPYNVPFLPATVLSIITSLLFFASVLLHELTHSFVAKRNGLGIKRITLFLFGGVAQMTEEPSSPQIEFKMAIAGPCMSFFLALVFGVLWFFVTRFDPGITYTAPFEMLSLINLGLAIFNLLPGFPLDGGRIARAVLWYFTKNVVKATRIASYAGQAIAFFLIFIGFIAFISNFGFGGLWLMLIGWFLNNAAQQGYRQMELQHSLSNVKVEEIMTRDVVTIYPELPVDQLVNDYFLRYKFGRFPVVEGHKLLGVVTLHDVKEVPRENWVSMTAGQIITKAGKNIEVTPGEEVFKALMQMAQEDIGHLLVVKNSQLEGLITKSDIMRLIRIRTGLGM